MCRHAYLHFPDDEVIPTLDAQFMLGPDLMVAPVMDKGRNYVRTYLPAG